MRALTVKNLYDKKSKTIPFRGEWEKVFGNPTFNGIWLVYGQGKNGKTWISLKLADVFTDFDRVLYISAEEGTDKEFSDTCQRVGIDTSNRKLHFVEYVPFDEVEVLLKKRKSRRVIFIDNLTVYKDELKGKKLFEIMQKYPNHLFILIAHEERNEPYTAVAKLAAKLAKIIIHVKGLTCQVYGRCPGGVVTIDESKSMLYWGTQIHQNKEE